MKKIFITGGTGFIGRNLKEQLKSKYSIYAPSHSELDLLDEDAVSQLIKKRRFDAVIHTAAWSATRNSPKDISKELHLNLEMFFNLARCSEYYQRMIYYGSGAEYDRQHWVPKMKEDYFDRHVPEDGYGFSKYIMAKYAGFSPNIYDLRLFGIFGKYEDWEIRFISNACCKAVWDLPITIKQNVLFDYLYVDDLVKLTEWFIENNPSNKFYNLCTGQAFDLKTLAGRVLEASGKKLDIVIGQKGMGREYSGDNSRLLSEMGGFSFRNIDACIKELYQWYLAHKDSIDKKKLLADK